MHGGKLLGGYLRLPHGKGLTAREWNLGSMVLTVQNRGGCFSSLFRLQVTAAPAPVLPSPPFSNLPLSQGLWTQRALRILFKMKKDRGKHGPMGEGGSGKVAVGNLGQPRSKEWGEGRKKFSSEQRQKWTLRGPPRMLNEDAWCLQRGQMRSEELISPCAGN